MLLNIRLTKEAPIFLIYFVSVIVSWRGRQCGLSRVGGSGKEAIEKPPSRRHVFAPVSDPEIDGRSL